MPEPKNHVRNTPWRWTAGRLSPDVVLEGARHWGPGLLSTPSLNRLAAIHPATLERSPCGPQAPARFTTYGEFPNILVAADLHRAPGTFSTVELPCGVGAEPSTLGGPSLARRQPGVASAPSSRGTADLIAAVARTPGRAFPDPSRAPWGPCTFTEATP